MKRYYPKEYRTPTKPGTADIQTSKKNSVSNPLGSQISLTKSTTFAHQSLNVKCQQPGHQTNDLICVCLNKKCDQESRLCCAKCVKSGHQAHGQYMAKITDFLKSEQVEDLVFKIDNWPGDSELTQVKQFLLEEEAYILGIRQKVENYFADLLEKVTQQIEKIKGKYVQEMTTFYTRGPGKDKAEFIKVLKQHFMSVYDVKDIQKNIRELLNREIAPEAFHTKLEFQLTNKETLEKQDSVLKFFNNKQFQGIKAIKATFDEKSVEQVNSFLNEGFKRLNKTTGSIGADGKKEKQATTLPYSSEGSKEPNVLFHDIMNYLMQKNKEVGSKDLLQYKQEVYADGSTYDGFLLNGQRHLIGVRNYCDRNIYCGEYANGQRHGFGLFYYEKGGMFEGNTPGSPPLSAALALTVARGYCRTCCRSHTLSTACVK